MVMTGRKTHIIVKLIHYFNPVSILKEKNTAAGYLNDKIV